MAGIRANEDSLMHINLLVDYIEGKLNRLEPPLSPECCIYMVPKTIRSVNEAAYAPKVVSIGPLHHGKETLEKMEMHKLWYLNKFLERASTKGVTLKDFVITITELESRIRSCYEETFDDLCEFVQMIPVDASFIIEFIFRDSDASSKDENDFILYKPLLAIDIYHDLCLLDNQLPFFILEQLYDLAFSPGPNEFPSFHVLICLYFSYYNKQNKFIPEEVKVKHFTDLLRYFQLPPRGRPEIYEGPKQNDKFISSATKLRNAGVKFKVSSSECLLDIKFSNGVLAIPCLKVHDSTEAWFRNLMALEQCRYPYETYICNYVLFMGCLMNTTKDVDLLVQKKIIVNWLVDRRLVATLFDNLSKHIVVSNDSCYTGICEELNKYCEVRSHKCKAILWSEYYDYFSARWKFFQ